MNYILKLYDTELLKFSMEIDGIDGFKVKFISIYDEKKAVFPIDLSISDNGIKKWLQKRVIPKNRAFVHEILKMIGLSYNDTKGIIDICKGLSLNDSYWIVPENFMGKFSEYNLYENKFSEVLSLVAYTGVGGGKTPFTTSPELTTNGMLPKAWRNVEGEICLYKSGTEGAANTGLEPYSEYYASQIARAMGLNAVFYDLEMFKGRLASVCKLFTNIDTSYIPIGRIVTEGGLSAVLDYYKKLGNNFYNDVCSMLVFDAVVFNDDRHFGNFGVLRENKTGKIVVMAPIFDNGLSLFNFAMDSDLENLSEYASVRVSATGASHIDIVKDVITAQQKQQLRHLIGFTFERHEKYNLPAHRIKALEAFIQTRVSELLNL